MSINALAHLFRVTTWAKATGLLWGPRLTAAPPVVTITEEMNPQWMDQAQTRPRTNTPRSAAKRDEVRILSGCVRRRTTGNADQAVIENTDRRSKDYGDIKDKSAPSTPTSRISRNTAPRLSRRRRSIGT